MSEGDSAPSASSHDAPALPGTASSIPYVVGIGASAGGLDALEAFFRAVSPKTGLTFVVVQHLSPDHKSHMASLLGKQTSMNVVEAEEGQAVQADTVYLLPPRKTITLAEGKLRLAERGTGFSLPIDIMFQSLALECGEKSAGIVLSGTGSDGTRGVRALKEVGALVLVQDPLSARFDGMPRAAISTGLVDYVATPEEMGARLAELVARSGESLARRKKETVASDAFEAFMQLLEQQTGVNFAYYKPSTVVRRLQRRMAIWQMDSLDEYLAFARSSPREVNLLYKDLLISVTKFFRDAEIFAYCERELIPELIEAAPANDTIRIWVAGCATGEEAYSLAMLFEEGMERASRSRDFKIFATDLDRSALEAAGNGWYAESVCADVSPERLNRFFIRQGDGYQVTRVLRQRVVFAHHDLLRNPPFSRVSLISCRNVLIYFGAELQAKVLESFRFALSPGAFLLLGNSETAGDVSEELEIASAANKVWRRTNKRVRGPGFELAPRSARVPRVAAPSLGRRQPTSGLSQSTLDRAFDLVLGAFVPPTVLVNDQQQILFVFGEPSPLLKLGSGAASLDLRELLPPEIASMVGLAVHSSIRDRRAAHYASVPVPGGAVEVSVRPVELEESGVLALVSLTPKPVTNAAAAPSISATFSRDAEKQIDVLQQELEFSRESLQTTVEELETSNEELQATNEELIASNEELQSTNEELQSVNEELHTLNAEHQQKILELVRLNDDINNLLVATRLGIIFLDQTLHITRFTPAARQVMNILDRDIGRPVSDLSLNVERGAFMALLESVQRNGNAIEQELPLTHGQHLMLRVAPYVADGNTAAGLVITVLDVTAVKQAELRLASILDALPHQLAVVEPSGVISSVNEAWRRFARENGGDDRRTGVGVNYLDVVRGAVRSSPELARLPEQLEALLRGGGDGAELEYPCHSPDEQRWFLLQATALGGGLRGAVISHVNITKRKLLELAAERQRIPQERHS